MVVVQAQTVVVLFCPAVMSEMIELATLNTEDSGGIEKGKLVSIVLLGKSGPEVAGGRGPPIDGEGFDVVVPTWTVSVTVLV